MGVSGNSVAGKSFQMFTVSDDLLAKVVEAVQAGDKEARSSGVIQSLEVFCRGFRQNISLGRIYIVPPAVCSDRKNFPTALMHGALVRVFGGGEEMADFIEKQIGDSEFDDYSQADFDTLKTDLFTDDTTGKETCLVIFAPNWMNSREYICFHFTKDEGKLKNNLRHQVFSAYFDPRVSSAFNALMTNVNTTKVDVTDITPKMNFPFLGENVLKQYPLLEKQAGAKKATILLNHKTADAITKETLDPQELDVFDSLNQALENSLVPDADGAQGEGGFTAPSDGEGVPRAASATEQKPDPKKAPTKLKNEPFVTGYKCSCPEFASKSFCQHVPKQHAAPKHGAKDEKPLAAHEAPFTNVGPGTEAEDAQKDMVPAMKEQSKDVAKVSEEAGSPIGIPIDENGVPRREGDKQPKHEKTAHDKAPKGRVLPQNKPRFAYPEAAGERTFSASNDDLTSDLSRQIGGWYEGHTDKIKDYAGNVASARNEHPPHAVRDHAAKGKEALLSFDHKKWGDVEVPVNFDGKIAREEFVAEHIAAQAEETYDAASIKEKAARAKKESSLDKFRSKEAVSLDINSIWDEITEDMGPAPLIDVDTDPSNTAPSNTDNNSEGFELNTSEGEGESEERTGRPNKRDVGELPEAFRSDEPEDDKSTSEDRQEEPKWHASAENADFVSEVYDDVNNENETPLVASEDEAVVFDNYGKTADVADNEYDIDAAADPTNKETGESSTCECHKDTDEHGQVYASKNAAGAARLANKIMRIDNVIWDKLGIESGGQIMEDPELAKRYKAEVLAALAKAGIKQVPTSVVHYLENENYHRINNVIMESGLGKYEDGTEGQDRKSYSDDQDRDNYVPDPKLGSGKTAKPSWKMRLQDSYDNNFEQWEMYDRNYGLAQRLGFSSAEEAWQANPVIQGSVDPADFSVVSSDKTADTADNPANEKGGEGAILPKTDAEISDTQGKTPKFDVTGAKKTKTADTIDNLANEQGGEGAMQVKTNKEKTNTRGKELPTANPIGGKTASAPNEQYGISSEAASQMVGSIRPGDRVTILVPAGRGRNGQEWAERTGTARIVSPGHVALNMGGQHGTPGIATAGNIISVRKARKQADTADNPYNMMNDGEGAPENKKVVEKKDTSGPTPVNTKQAADVSGDFSEAKSETVSPDTVDEDISEPTVSVEEAGKRSSQKVADMDMKKAIQTLTKQIFGRLSSGQDVREELEVLNFLRTQAGLKPMVIPHDDEGAQAPDQGVLQPKRQNKSLAPSEPEPEAGGNIVHIPSDAKRLPDNDAWKNRFDYISESSGSTYRISQNKVKGYWGCTCWPWKKTRNCPHLRQLGIPGNEQPFEAMLKQGSVTMKVAMMFMNRYDVDEAVQRFARDPVLGKATRFLKAFMDEVDSHSDGWSYWGPPVQAAKQLMTLIQAGEANQRGQYTNAPQTEITEQAFLKALRPIKAFYTRRGNEAGMQFPKIGADISNDMSDAEAELEYDKAEIADDPLAVNTVNPLHFAAVPEVTRYGQKFYEEDANRLHPEGCRCTSTDAGGDCEWCDVYYNGPQEFEQPRVASAGDEYSEEVALDFGAGDLADIVMTEDTNGDTN